MKLKRSFASPVRHVVSIPNCITSHVQCSLGQIWEVYACFITTLLTQMEVNFDTHVKSIPHKLKSIWYKLKSFRSKSELEEISQCKCFPVRIANDSYRWQECHPRRRKMMFVWRSQTFSASWICWIWLKFALNQL